MKTVLLALNASYSHTSLSIRYLSAACKDHGLAVDSLEMTINERPESIAAQVFKLQPDVLACSVYIWNVRIMEEVCLRLKLMLPHLKIIWGGPEVSSHLIGRHAFLDHMCVGEGEDALPPLLESISRGEDSHAFIQGTRPELDSLKDPYHGEIFLDNKLYYFESSRGCPFACAYCLSSSFSGVRFMSLEVAKERLTRLASEVELVKFVDRTFNANPQRARQLWSFLLTLPGACRFHFEICAHLLTEEDFAILQKPEAHRFQFEIGVQSTHAPALKAINRNMDVKELLLKAKRLKSLNTVEIHLDLIAGLPGEALGAFMTSLDETLSVLPERLHLGFLKLLPGTTLRAEAEQHCYAYLPFAPYEVLSSRDIAAEELLALKDLAHVLDRFYNSGKLVESMRFMLNQITPRQLLSELVPHVDKDIFSGLHGAGESLGVDTGFLRDVLRFDYLQHQPHRAVPSWLGHDLDEQAAVRQIVYGERDELYGLLPHRTGERPGAILKDLRLGQFSPEVMKHLGFDPEVTELLFDHSQPVKQRVFAVRR